MDIRLTTYIEGEETLKAAVEIGVTKVLVEEPYFSLLCRRDRGAEIDYNSIITNFELGKKLNPDLEIFFNLDLVLHHQDLNEIYHFIRKIQQIGLNGIRVQDIGLLNWLNKQFPDFPIDLNTITGNYNWQAVSFFEKRLSPSLKTIVLSKEIPWPDLKTIVLKSSLKNEILVHGPILMSYSKRRLISESPFSELGQISKDCYGLFLKEQKRPEEWFYFYDNAHGTFMFFCHELCLIQHIDKIIDTGISDLLFDFRGHPPATMKEVLTIYRNRLSDDAFLAVNKAFTEQEFALKKLYPQGLTDGFFFNNPTNSNTVMAKKKDSSIYTAKVVGVIKEKVIAIETAYPFSNQDLLTVITPEQKTFTFTPLFVQNLEGKEIESAEPGAIVLLNWRKGITVESLCYLGAS